MICQLLLHILAVGDVDVFRFYAVFFLPFGQHHFRLRSHQNADLFAVQCFEVRGGDICARKVGIEVIFFLPHRFVRKQHLLSAILRIRNTAHDVDLAVFKFFKAV